MADEKGRERRRAAEGQDRGPAVVCIGGVVVDRTYRTLGAVRPATSNPVTGSRGFGGVAGNVAANLARLDVPVALVSMVGDDESGRAAVRHATGLGIDTRWVTRAGGRTTAEYIALLDPNGDLVLGLADMAIFEDLSPEQIRPALGSLGDDDWIFADCNLPCETLAWLLDDRAGAGRLAVDVVSTPKAERLPHDLHGLDLLFLNRDEAAVLLHKPAADLDPLTAIDGLLRRGAGAVVLTLGSAGLATGTADGVTRVPASPAVPVDVTGAGDALVGTMLAYLASGSSLAEAARFGSLAAALTVACQGGTHPGLSREQLSRPTDRLPPTSPAHSGYGLDEP